MSNRIEQSDLPAPGHGPAVTWRLRIGFDGTAFRGWQIQPNQRTVQGEMQKRIRLLFRSPDLSVYGSSRTDAGVHALDHVVSFTAPAPQGMDSAAIRRTLNRWLPEDIRVHSVDMAERDFHARYSSVGKAYVYSIFHGEKPDPMSARFVWHYPRALDPGPMLIAAGHLVGRHDFRSFAVNPRRPLDAPHCHLFRVTVEEITDDLLCVVVIGDRFLYKMVRGIVGYLLHIGHGKDDPERTAAVLAARDRSAAAESAPARGLVLTRVFYGDEDPGGFDPPLPPFTHWDTPCAVDR